MTRLVVEKVHRLSSRPWIFITGTLQGDALNVGDELTVTGDVRAVVRSIELHTAASKTTVAVDASFAAAVHEGVVLTSTSPGS